MSIHYHPWHGDPRDPECPYDDDFTPEDEEDAYWREVDRRIDERMEEN